MSGDFPKTTQEEIDQVYIFHDNCLIKSSVFDSFLCVWDKGGGFHILSYRIVGVQSFIEIKLFPEFYAHLKTVNRHHSEHDWDSRYSR